MSSGRPFTYPEAVRAEAVRLIAEGATFAEVSRRLGASTGAICGWLRAQHRAHVRRQPRAALEPLAIGTHLAGVIVQAVAGRQVRPGVYAPAVARTPDQLARTCYRVRCAVCGAGMTPVSHGRLMQLDAEYDVVNCVHCWKKERRA